MLWALLPWFMVCAWLVRAAGPSVLQCGLPDCLGVCAEGFSGPRLVLQAFKLKSFHDLYLLSRSATWDIYTSFANFERIRTNRPAILSLIPVLGWKDKSILVPHLTSASKEHHRRQISLFLPCQDKLAKKEPPVRMHATAFAAVCTSYHHDVYKNTHKHTVLRNLYVMRHTANTEK